MYHDLFLYSDFEMVEVANVIDPAYIMSEYDNIFSQVELDTLASSLPSDLRSGLIYTIHNLRNLVIRQISQGLHGFYNSNRLLYFSQLDKTHKI